MKTWNRPGNLLNLFLFARTKILGWIEKRRSIFCLKTRLRTLKTTFLTINIRFTQPPMSRLKDKGKAWLTFKDNMLTIWFKKMPSGLKISIYKRELYHLKSGTTLFGGQMTGGSRMQIFKVKILELFQPFLGAGTNSWNKRYFLSTQEKLGILQWGKESRID